MSVRPKRYIALFVAEAWGIVVMVVAAIKANTKEEWTSQVKVVVVGHQEPFSLLVIVMIIIFL
ncbi:MAG: hypothetical protein JO297_14720 [Nitrososphaeraceae archaeon]|nr:hypothetical protein [Nitrososphaeraceae archaeon]